MMDQREDFGIKIDSNKSTDKGSESTGEMVNVLSSMGAANILASGGLKEVFTTASLPVPPVCLIVPTVAATASEKDSTAAVITTTTVDKIELITYLAKYHKDLAQIKKYQAQQYWKRLSISLERNTRFVPMDSKLESERFKRPGSLLEKERAKRLKIVEGSEQQFEGNKDVKEKDSDDHDKIINLQQWVVLIFRVGQAPKAYPYFEAMLKEFDRDDMFMFEPVASDGLWQFEAPTKSWRLYKSCRVHCLIMEGMIIYMLDDVEYPLPKTTLQKMLDHKCEVCFIMYAVRCTRPDVAFAQNTTSCFQQNPGEPHWTAVKTILKYLRNTKEMFLVYGRNPEAELRDEIKSQTRYVFVLNGNAVDWKSSKTKCYCNACYIS
ncbi:hypothetical protein Tco_0226243 [Tanacetum coccineum]